MRIILLAITLALAACSDKENNDIINTLINTNVPTQKLDKIDSVGYPYHAADGNRYVTGHADISSITPQDIDLPASAEWIATVADGNNSYWAAALSNGDIKAFKVSTTGNEPVDISPASLGTAVPLTLVLADGKLTLANVFEDGSPYSPPVIVDLVSGSRAYIANNGDLVLYENEKRTRLPINALPYSRILIDENNRLLVLSDPTLRYDHQVLGSAHSNAAAITLVKTDPEFKVDTKIIIDSPDVIEGNPLIWLDVNNDGKREIITTLSTVNDGARIKVFNEDGSTYSESATIGQGYRWRQQIAVAPFQNDNQLDLVSIYIPHLGPNAEFFRLDDGSMNVTRTPINYSSHLFISLNLDKSIAGDFDNDGRPELLVINRNTQKELAAVSYTNDTVNVDWTLPLNGVVTSNIAAVTLDNGKIALGIGQGNSLRIWQP